MNEPAQTEVIRQLRKELEEAKDRIEELGRLIGLKLSVPSSLRLTAQMADILGVILSARGVVTVSMLETVLFGSRPSSDWPSWPRKVILVQINRLRAALDAHKIEIKTCAGADGARGYFMSHDNKSKARALIATPILNDDQIADQPSRDCAARPAQASRGGGLSLPLGQAS